MKIVQVDDLPYTSRANKGRGGTGHKARVIFDSAVLSRDPSRVDNFYFGFSSSGEGEFSSPRHRHIFDQFRYMVKGCGDYPEGLMTDGVLGYFPQGAYYGPQDRLYGDLFILQFGGPSGQGYVDRQQMQKASAEIMGRNSGAFEGGSYHRNPGIDGLPIQDAHEAIYEHVTGEPVTYPAPQYTTPILMDTNAYPWLPVEGSPGLRERALGTFTSCQYRAAQYEMGLGADLVAAGRGIYVVLSGSGTVENEPARQYTALYLEEGEGAVFHASETTVVLLLGLPNIARMSPTAKRLKAAA